VHIVGSFSGAAVCRSVLPAGQWVSLNFLARDTEGQIQADPLQRPDRLVTGFVTASGRISEHHRRREIERLWGLAGSGFWLGTLAVDQAEPLTVPVFCTAGSLCGWFPQRLQNPLALSTSHYSGPGISDCSHWSMWPQPPQTPEAVVSAARAA